MTGFLFIVNSFAPIDVVRNDSISSFLPNIPLCMCVHLSKFPCQFICWLALLLIPCLVYYESCYNWHEVPAFLWHTGFYKTLKDTQVAEGTNLLQQQVTRVVIWPIISQIFYGQQAPQGSPYPVVLLWGALDLLDMGTWLTNVKHKGRSWAFQASRTSA